MILIGLGANLPFQGRTPVRTMENAIRFLETRTGSRLEALSPWYRTAPVGKTDQPDFFNGVARIASPLEPLALMEALLGVERAFGRIREDRWGPRTLDLDLLDHEGQVMAVEEGPVPLTLPHPRLVERAFVLQPLLDVAPDWRHPVSGLGAAELLAKIGGAQDICRLDPDPA